VATKTSTRARERGSRARPTGVATGRVAGAPKPGPEQKRLEVFIGKWMTEGETVASEGLRAVKILASDVYEWVPGGFFVPHTAYGRVGSIGVGGVDDGHPQQGRVAPNEGPVRSRSWGRCGSRRRRRPP
jgi:hypothetical protein